MIDSEVGRTARGSSSSSISRPALVTQATSGAKPSTCSASFIRNSRGMRSGKAQFSCPLSLIMRSEEHTSELQSRLHLVCRLLLDKKTTATLATLSFGAHDTRAPFLISVASRFPLRTYLPRLLVACDGTALSLGDLTGASTMATPP